MKEICRGCGEEIDGEVGVLWCRADLGMTVLKVHRTQECAKGALAATGYKLLKDNKPPESKQDRMRREARGG